MTHTIIKSKKGVFHRLDKLQEVSMKTGNELRYGLTFIDQEDIKARGFEVIEEIENDVRFRFGYC